MKLYSNQKTGQKCLYTEQTIKCDECEKQLQGGIYVEQYSKKLPAHRAVYCNKCLDKAPKGYDIVNKQILVGGYVPKESIRWVSKPPTLITHKNSGTIFSSAQKEDGSRIIDNTVHADRLSLEGANIGLLEEEVRVPTEEEFKLLITAEPITPKQLTSTK